MFIRGEQNGFRFRAKHRWMAAIFQAKLQTCNYGKINSAFHCKRTGTKIIKLILQNIDCILKSNNWSIQKEKQNFSQSKFALAYNKCSHTQKLCLQVKSLVPRAVGLQVRRVSAAVSQYYSPCRLALGRKSSSNSKRRWSQPHAHTHILAAHHECFPCSWNFLNSTRSLGRV
jgi:hypothetical protein